MRSAKETLAAELAQSRADLSEAQRENTEFVRIKEQKEGAVRALAVCSQDLERAAMMEAEFAKAQAITKSSQLIDAEAALGKSKAARRNRGIWATFLPSTGRSYVLERRLIRTGLFETDWYKSQYPEVAESGLSAARHYQKEGYCRGYRPNPLFDTRWYLERYEDVRRSGMNPLLAMHGYREGRDPSPDFQTNFYLLTYPDVRASKMNPLAHYLLYERAEGRMPVRPPGFVDKGDTQIG